MRAIRKLITEDSTEEHRDDALSVGRPFGWDHESV